MKRQGTAVKRQWAVKKRQDRTTPVLPPMSVLPSAVGSADSGVGGAMVGAAATVRSSASAACAEVAAARSSPL